MGVIHITSFCWCLGLEAGSKLIGFLHLLTSLGLMITFSVTAAAARDYIGTVEDAEDNLYTKLYKITVTLAVFTVVHVMLALTLLYSVYKRYSPGVRVWTVCMAASLVLSAAYLVYSLTFGFSSSGSDIFVAFLEGILFFGVVSYCILCVYSYSLLLRSCEDADTHSPAHAGHY